MSRQAEWNQEEVPARRLWLMTLADLSLLLVGFFVLLQANQKIEPQRLAAGIRAAFGSEAAMPVELAAVGAFAPGSAQLPVSAPALAWAREAARDPRTRLTVTGEVDGSAADVDPATGSGSILAADRARAVAAALIASGAVAPGRVSIVTGTGERRVVLTLGYDGGRQ
jgi:flagellar motor protein MotB